MKYLGYAIIALSFTAGFLAYPGILILLFALISTLIYATSRRKAVKDTPMSLKQNMALDGVFLFFLQCLIMFVAYLLGIFAASAAGDQFYSFISGGH